MRFLTRRFIGEYDENLGKLSQLLLLMVFFEKACRCIIREHFDFSLISRYATDSQLLHGSIPQFPSWPTDKISLTEIFCNGILVQPFLEEDK